MIKTGIVEDVKFTFGSFGNQWTTIDGVRYATYWDAATTDWKRGDKVCFECGDRMLCDSPPVGPAPHAWNINKIKETADAATPYGD